MSFPIRSAFLLAAGEGRRLNPITLTQHKALLNLPNGEPIRNWLLALHDFSNITVNVYHLADQVVDFVSFIKPKAQFSFESSLLDSGGGIRHALPFIDEETFLVINTDIVGDIQGMIGSLIKSWRGDEGGRILLVPTPSTHPGDCDIDSEGRVSFIKGGPLTMAGVQICRAGSYKNYPDGEVFSNLDIWKGLASSKKLFGTVFDGKWLDIGTFERLRQAGYQDKTP